jgi:hypothetical protein
LDARSNFIVAVAGTTPARTLASAQKLVEEPVYAFWFVI